MTIGSTNASSAAGPALGYLTQVEYGLLFLLKQMEEVVDLSVSLETSDDIVFELTGDLEIVQLWQTKHHVSRGGSLGDSSVDIWKTLFNWICNSSDEALVLLSTSSAPRDSAAQMLSSKKDLRNIDRASSKLETAATTSTNGALAVYFQKFLALTAKERETLLDRVTVIDKAPTSEDITEELLKTTRKSLQNIVQRRALVQRLRGWWIERVAIHLTAVARGERDKIELREVEDQLHYFLQFFRDENLPLDFQSLPEPTVEEVEGDQRIFVEQLRLIMIHSSRIRQAIYDHNRAFLQRSLWQREHLINLDELKSYDLRLIEEWRRFFNPIGQEDLTADEESKQTKARNALVKFEQQPLPEPRTEMHSGYIPIGSLHILADELEIGWHPDWVDLLRYHLPEIENSDIRDGVA